MAESDGANPQAGGRSGSKETSSNPQAGASESQGNNSIDSQQGDSQHPQAGEENTLPPDRIREIMRENQALRKAAKERETADQAKELASLDELSRTQKQLESEQVRNADLLIKLQSKALSEELMEHGPALGITDFGLARKALLTEAGLETDEDGNYTNFKKVLEKLVSEHPSLVANTLPRPAPSPTSGGATNPGRSSVSPAQPAPPTAKELYERHRQSGGMANPGLWKRNP
jgi:hypothetical protein